MDQTVQFIIIAAVLVIAVLVLTTSKNGRKFESAHNTGLYKTGLAVKLFEFAFLILFCVVTFLTLKSFIGYVAGYVLMTVFFVSWVPFQFWIYTYVFLDEEGITYFRPSGKSANIPWKDIKIVTSDRLGIIIRSAKGNMRIYSFFNGFDKIKLVIKEHCPGVLE
jgi:hypothetical protein